MTSRYLRLALLPNLHLLRAMTTMPRRVFVYGSLRPDDDSGAPWTTAAVANLRAQRAVLPGAVLFKDISAAVKPREGGEVRGWVLGTDEEGLWGRKLRCFDVIEGYDPEEDAGKYLRRRAEVQLEEGRLM